MTSIEEMRKRQSDTDAKLTAANRELERLSRELEDANYKVVTLVNRMQSISALASKPVTNVESPHG